MDTLLERYTNITATSGIAFVYHYNSKGLLSRIDLCEVSFDDTEITSSTLVSSEKYYYDASDRLYKVEEVTPGDDSSELTVHSYECEFDAKENVTRLVEAIDGTSYTYVFTYDDDGKPTAVTYGGITEEISYDALGRSTRQRMQENGSTVVDRRYTYKNIDDEKTTTLVSRVSNTFGSASLNFSYRYDANGNITRVDDGTSITSYTYNSRNELSWEKNAAAGKAWYYAHDYGGNITRRTEYDYIDGELSGTGTVIIYRYGDSGWKDKLTSYNGQTITYDAIDNPLSYRGMTMTWQGGRQLAALTTGNDTLSFAYNESGLRNEKTVNNEKHTYYWINGKLSAEICDAYSLFFHYNANGDILGFSYSTNGTTTEYYYVKNLQGDVLRVVDASGTVAACYTYDAWGRVLSSSGSMASINPIRYRGYYYDTETGLYYLQSRYYDPEVCRFINADAYVSTGQGILGYNMFAYCGNNPIIHIDSYGTCYYNAYGEWCHDNWEYSGGYQIKQKPIDITIHLNEAMIENAAILQSYSENHSFFKSSLFFANKVRTNGEWDFKNQPSWNLSSDNLYSYNKVILRYDDIGNIHYGYVGYVLFTENILKVAGGLVQIKSGTSKWSYWNSNFDDPRDQWAIGYGISLWNMIGN